MKLNYYQITKFVWPISCSNDAEKSVTRMVGEEGNDPKEEGVEEEGHKDVRLVLFCFSVIFFILAIFFCLPKHQP